MPRVIDYPRAPLDRALALAEAVDKLGGEATAESAAESMGNKVGGAFNSLIGAAVKYGLVTNSKGRVKTEPLFQDYKLAYSETQKREAIRRAFMNAPLFEAIVNRLQGQTIPGHFEKLLVREHDVAADTAPRIVSYFTEGARQAGILNSNGIINGAAAPSGSVQAQPTSPVSDGGNPQDETEADVSAPFIRGYTVRITGPGIDSRIAIKDEDDVDIVDIMLKKVRKLLKQEVGGAS